MLALHDMRARIAKTIAILALFCFRKEGGKGMKRMSLSPSHFP